MKYVINVFKKYAVFKGRARRAEYWSFVLFNAIILIPLYIWNIQSKSIIVDNSVKISLTNSSIHAAPVIQSAILSLYLLVTFLPSLSVMVRRLHDSGKSGWWWFLGIIPVIGPLCIIILMTLNSTSGENKYGSNPKESEIGHA